MTSTQDIFEKVSGEYDIFGKTLHGGKYTVAEGFSVGSALRLVNRLNREARDGFFHHFYASRTEVAAPLVVLLPGEKFGLARTFVAWLILAGVVESKPGGRYQVGEETIRGQVAVAERFGTLNGNGEWTAARLIYKTPAV